MTLRYRSNWDTSPHAGSIVKTRHRISLSGRSMALSLPDCLLYFDSHLVNPPGEAVTTFLILLSNWRLIIHAHIDTFIT